MLSVHLVACLPPFDKALLRYFCPSQSQPPAEILLQQPWWAWFSSTLNWSALCREGWLIHINGHLNSTAQVRSLWAILNHDFSHFQSVVGMLYIRLPWKAFFFHWLALWEKDNSHFYFLLKLGSLLLQCFEFIFASSTISPPSPLWETWDEK